MKVMFTFPGQGTQYPGMLSHLPDSAETAALLSLTEQVLGEPISILDTPQALAHTRAVQLCLLIAGVSFGQHLIAQGTVPDMVCGLSIGAFPAAVIAGAISYEDAVRLVALRGELMEQAWPTGYGLTAIMGLRLGQVETLVDNHTTWVANMNAERQIVIAGSDSAMVAVAERAMALGAEKARRLDISVPSHCPLLDAPAKQLASAMKEVTVSRPHCTYLSGSSARALWDPARIADDLAFNMARTVHWQDAMIAAMERDVRLFVEMPPGSVLTGLTKQATCQGEAVSVAQTGEGVINHLARRLKMA